MPTTATIGTSDELAPVIGEVAAGATRIVGEVNAIVAAVDAVIDVLPAEIVALVHAKLDELKAHLGDAVALIDHVVAYAGDPAALRRFGDAWATEVGSRVSGLSSVMTLTTMETDDQWHGVAATAYRNTLPSQSAALASITATTHRINDILQELATAIVTFWVATSAALATLVVALVAAVPVAATGVGAPAAAGWGIAALVAFTAAVTTEILALTAVMGAAERTTGALENAMTNDSAFPKGGWPVSTTGLGDASLRDGDDTDWKVGP